MERRSGNDVPPDNDLLSKNQQGRLVPTAVVRDAHSVFMRSCMLRRRFLYSHISHSSHTRHIALELACLIEEVGVVADIYDSEFYLFR